MENGIDSLIPLIFHCSYIEMQVISVHRCKIFFFACGSSAPVRVECEDVTAAWLVGTLAVPSVLPVQAFRRLPCHGPFSVVQHVRHI